MSKFIAAAALVASTLAFGHLAVAQPPAGPGTAGGVGATQALSWEQFQDACVNPGKYNNQRPQQNIRVTCEHLRNIWEDGGARTPGQSLDNGQQLTASVMSDKYHIERQQFDVEVPQTRTACSVLRQIEERYSEQLDLTCADIQKFRGSLGDFCMQYIGQDINDRSKVQRRPTGQVYNTCNGAGQETGGESGARGGQKGS